MGKIINLKNRASFFVKPVSPYDFDSTVFKPSHYPDHLKFYEPGRYWFVLRLGNRVYGIKLVSKGTIRSPKVQVIIFSRTKLSKKELKEVIDEVSYRFEFQKDISGFFKKFKNDKILSSFLKKWYGMHGSCAQDLYGLLMIGIFLQNTVIKRSIQMTDVMLKKYGIKVKFDGKELYYFVYKGTDPYPGYVWSPPVKITIKDNTSLVDFCALKDIKVTLANNLPFATEIKGNAFNPSFDNIRRGECKP